MQIYIILFWGPPIGTFLHETTSFDVLIVKIGAQGLAVRRHQTKKKRIHFVRIATCGGGGENPFSDRNEILHRGRGPQSPTPNLVTIGSGVLGTVGESNFTLFHGIPLTSVVILKTLWHYLPVCDCQRYLHRDAVNVCSMRRMCL